MHCRADIDKPEIDRKDCPPENVRLICKSSKPHLNPLVLRSPGDGRLARIIPAPTGCFGEHPISLASIRAKLRATQMKLQEKEFQKDLFERVRKCSSQFRTNKEAMGLWKQEQQHQANSISGESMTDTWWQVISSRMI